MAALLLYLLAALTTTGWIGEVGGVAVQEGWTSQQLGNEDPQGSPHPVCYHQSTEAVIKMDSKDEILPGGRVRCGVDTDFCFSYWTYRNNTATEEKDLIWLAQGCFSSGGSGCSESVCAATRESPANTFFCCCAGALCNGVAMPPPRAVVSPLVGAGIGGETQRPHNSSRGGGNPPPPGVMLWHPVYWLAMAGTVMALSVLLALFVINRWRRRERKASLEDGTATHGHMGGGGCVKSNSCKAAVAAKKDAIDINSVVLLQVIGQGRFGCVYKARAGPMARTETTGTEAEMGTVVVVKVFPEDKKDSYENERNIYTQPFMTHPNLLEYLGSGPLGPERGYGLILSYCSAGRLSTYLAENTLSWAEMCKIAFTATSGLEHLHAPLTRGGLVKPSISHRDFNSRNLVLKADLSCVVCDLGFAVATRGGSYYRGGHRCTAGAAALNEVGTLRYMAPELVEGAVNLSECEAALKQIDVYALGLVLWECTTRCRDMVLAGRSVPEYKLPYQAELGASPRLDDIMEVVVRQKRRPQFPEEWDQPAPHNNTNYIMNQSDNNGTQHGEASPNASTEGREAALRLLKDTMDECWDADADARLSARCVMGRISQLPVLWRPGPPDQSNTENANTNDDGYMGDGRRSITNEIFITENFYMDLLPQNEQDDFRPPAYTEANTTRDNVQHNTETNNLQCNPQTPTLQQNIGTAQLQNHNMQENQLQNNTIRDYLQYKTGSVNLLNYNTRAENLNYNTGTNFINYNTESCNLPRYPPLNNCMPIPAEEQSEVRGTNILHSPTEKNVDDRPMWSRRAEEEFSSRTVETMLSPSVSMHTTAPPADVIMGESWSHSSSLPQKPSTCQSLTEEQTPSSTMSLSRNSRGVVATPFNSGTFGTCRTAGTSSSREELREYISEGQPKTLHGSAAQYYAPLITQSATVTNPHHQIAIHNSHNKNSNHKILKPWNKMIRKIRRGIKSDSGGKKITINTSECHISESITLQSTASFEEALAVDDAEVKVQYPDNLQQLENTDILRPSFQNSGVLQTKTQNPEVLRPKLRKPEILRRKLQSTNTPLLGLTCAPPDGDVTGNRVPPCEVATPLLLMRRSSAGDVDSFEQSSGSSRSSNSRPVSLSLEQSSKETSTGLCRYLSNTSFDTPENVYLRKSKTRVKTPRRPPLPRMSLHTPKL